MTPYRDPTRCTFCGEPATHMLGYFEIALRADGVTWCTPVCEAHRGERVDGKPSADLLISHRPGRDGETVFVGTPVERPMSADELGDEIMATLMETRDLLREARALIGRRPADQPEASDA